MPLCKQQNGKTKMDIATAYNKCAPYMYIHEVHIGTQYHYFKNKSWEKNLHRIWQECQVTMATRFCMVVPDICGSSAWNMLHITLLAPRILGWLLEIGKICGPLADSIYINFNLKYCSSQTILSMLLCPCCPT